MTQRRRLEAALRASHDRARVSGSVTALVDGFAAGALLVMLIDAMIPEAVREGGDVSGLVTVLGIALAAGLSALE